MAHSSSAPKGRPTPRRTQQHSGRRQGLGATAQWALVAVGLLIVLVVGGLLWESAVPDSARRTTPIGGRP